MIALPLALQMLYDPVSVNVLDVLAWRLMTMLPNLFC